MVKQFVETKKLYDNHFITIRKKNNYHKVYGMMSTNQLNFDLYLVLYPNSLIIRRLR